MFNDLADSNMKKMCVIWFSILTVSLVNGCMEAGTLGGGEDYKFDCSREDLQKNLEIFIKENPRFKIPQKLKKWDTWEEKGYGFLDGIVFYLERDSSNPEEMYYVTLVKNDYDDSNNTKPSYVAVRSVLNLAENPHWNYMHDLSKKEIARIENRFKSDILKKLNYCNLIEK